MRSKFARRRRLEEEAKDVEKRLDTLQSDMKAVLAMVSPDDEEEEKPAAAGLKEFVGGRGAKKKKERSGSNSWIPDPDDSRRQGINMSEESQGDAPPPTLSVPPPRPTRNDSWDQRGDENV